MTSAGAWPVLLPAAVLALAPLAAACASHLGQGAGRRRPEVHGHRGARAARPENTLPSFRHALEAGVDGIELDVLASRDDVVVVGHDPVLSRRICLAPGGGSLRENVAVRRLSFAQLRAFDCGSLRAPGFPEQTPVPGTPMPSLAEVIDLLKSSPLPGAGAVRLDVEVKRDPRHPELSPDAATFAALVVAVLGEHGFLERTNLLSFDHDVLRAARALEPRLARWALVDDGATDLVATGLELGASAVAPRARLLTERKVQALHRAGLAVHPWTVNDEAAWDRLARWDVDGIITDDPSRLVAFLSERRRR